MVWLEDMDGDNNTEVQFEVLKALARSETRDETLYLCHDPESDTYAERIAMMKQARDDIVMNVDESEDIIMGQDSAYLDSKLAYHCKLLDVLAGTAIGRTNITTVETKLQNLYPPEDCLFALLDPNTTLDVAGPLAAFFFHVVVEVEIRVPGLEVELLMWEFLERIPK